LAQAVQVLDTKSVQFTSMKALVSVMFFWYVQADPHGRWQHHPRTRGFNKAGPVPEVSSNHIKNAPHSEKDVDFKDPVELQKEIERMAERMKHMPVETSMEIADQLDEIETTLENSNHDKALHSEIVATREELCAERGFQGHQLGECERFMHRACGPDATSATRGPAARVPRHKCEHFYIAGRSGAAANVRMDARRVTHAAAAPSPGPSPAPGPQLFGGKFHRELPDQGFSGELGQHEDRKSAIKDWGREFGITSGHKNARAICAEHPNNEWCLIHGYYQNLKSGSRAVPVRATIAAVAILVSFLIA